MTDDAKLLDKEAEARALQTFLDYFLKNYPPHCILARPEWHAPKIFRAALYAVEYELLKRDGASGRKAGQTLPVG